MKKMSLLIVLLLVLAVFIGCSSEEVQSVFVDREGNEITLSGVPSRIISTSPSNTKILVSLGLGSKIIGISNYDVIDETIDPDVLLIDFRSPDLEAIMALEPSLLIASGHNKSGDDDPFKLLKEAGIPVAYIPSTSSILGIYDDVSFIAEVTDTVEQGEVVIQTMKTEIEKIQALAATVTEKKNVYFEIAPAPNVYTTGVGTFQNDIVEFIGANNVFADQEFWFSPSIESIIDKNPDIIITNVNYTEDPLGEILSRPGFEAISAVENGLVFQIDADLTSQPAPPVVEALWEMGRFVYPEIFK